MLRCILFCANAKNTGPLVLKNITSYENDNQNENYFMFLNSIV